MMPAIARFYGIVVKMYFKEHGIPHFDALYGEYNGVFDIETAEMDGRRLATQSPEDD